MSNYTKSTNFATKDALSSGNPLKIIKGTEIDTEFNNIQTAIATKADSSGSGTVTSVGGTGTVNGITLTGTVTSSGNLTLGGTLANVNLASQVTGTLPIANGGTGATSAASAVSNLGALPASNPSFTGTLTGASGLLLLGTTAATLSTNTFTVAAAKPALVLGNSTTADSTVILTCIKAGSTNSTSQKYVSFSYSSGSGGNGAIAGNGDSQATFVTDSDARLKENVVNLPSQLSNIMALRPVEFDYKASKGHQIGFIAQEVQEIYPDLISEGGDGYLSLAGLDKNAARLIKAIQELKVLVDAQAVRIAALESQ